MYRRPNAPFKPPRPLGTFSGGSPLPLGEKNDALLGSEVGSKNSSIPRLASTGSDKTNAVTTQQTSYKRVKPCPVLVRRKPSQLNDSLAKKLSNPSPKLAAFEGSDSTSYDPDQSSARGKKYFTVQWRKRSNKKNKSWEGDGFVVVSETGIVLRIQMPDESYKVVSRTTNTALEGIISVGVYEVEVDCETTRHKLFNTGELGGLETLELDSGARDEPVINSAFKRHSVQKTVTAEPLKAHVLAPEHAHNDSNESPMKPIAESPLDTLVLQSPTLPNVKAVIVDERLAKYLRRHQREGVSFLYECLMGMRNKNHRGALLADEMGLGKTLMTITLIWTLLRQSPVQGEKNAVNKVLICCPVSLIDNWRKEFAKWLDLNRIGILALNNKGLFVAKEKKDIVSFGKTKVYQVLIMNYEKVLACSIEVSTVGIDLLVCDEGHRLKSSANKVLKFLTSLPVEKRLVLTGTPIQNDLNEFYNIANFINPGLLGTISEFQKEFLKPILRARDVNCYDASIAKEGKEKSSLLIEITKSFTIRRTKAVIEEELTAKTDILLFCPPSKLQRKLINFVISSMGFNSLVSSATREVLPTINLLRKVCNSPSLLANDSFYKALVNKASEVPPELVPSALPGRTTGSKMNVVIPLLLHFRNAGENVVLVSNYTQTLDLLERALLKLNITHARLDGSTPLCTRDTLVTSFNKSKIYVVFLLSAKAGGIGLNLIGASRLILFDNDWNPLVDLQAMARIHRDGQKKPVYIYRLFTTGSIDEKIFQRQLMKNNLSDMFLDDNLESTLNIFDYEDLRDLFTVAQTSCNTHDLIDCDCSGNGEEVDLSPEPAQASQVSATHSPVLSQENFSQACRTSSSGWMSALEYKEMDQSSTAKKQTIRSALSHYRHFDPQNFENQMDTGDAILNELMTRAKGDITYVFTHQKGRQ